MNLHLIEDDFFKLFGRIDIKCFLCFREYFFLNFKISEQRQSSELAVTLGARYIEEGVMDPYLYEGVIKLLVELDRKNAGEALAYKAINLFPDYKNRFQTFL